MKCFLVDWLIQNHGLLGCSKICGKMFKTAPIQDLYLVHGCSPCDCPRNSRTWHGCRTLSLASLFVFKTFFFSSIWHSPYFLPGKRFCEPLYNRRSWETWWYDTSKQGIGALVIHMTNVYLAPLFQGDPCTWYGRLNYSLKWDFNCVYLFFVGILSTFYWIPP